MTFSPQRANPGANPIAPWLSVRNSAKAVEFYQSAFRAAEVYRLDGPGGSVVSRPSVGGADFWLSDESAEHGISSPQSIGGSTERLIFTVADPFGHHGEIGRPSSDS